MNPDSGKPERFGFAILGRSLDVQGMPELHDWLRTYWHFDEHDLPQHPFQIRVEPADELPPLPDAGRIVAGIPDAWLDVPGAFGDSPAEQADLYAVVEYLLSLEPLPDAAPPAADEGS